ncbi:hypothetical protein [Streptosporangium minutum]|uniref:Uncharacterized protein n=1 Tax=Streptosporangium minutum TaxID=569862 RepID=A0A243RS28_9ACTN|nr:hypothetical protein [Streptosporangium minutum]OUC97858.1 hypothetical protein CA984_09425 [Streptosporangium minutum]
MLQLYGGAAPVRRVCSVRRGHGAAALIYLHPEEERDKMVADSMGRLAEEAIRKNGDQEGSGA